MPFYPFLVLEIESGPQVPTFRNSTYLDPQVGLARDLRARHLSFACFLITLPQQVIVFINPPIHVSP